MKRLAFAAVPALLFALVPTSPAVAAPAKIPDKFGAPIYLALGDSVPAGVGAIPKVSGYPELASAQLRAGYNTAANKATPNKSTPLELRNIAVGGATTTSLIGSQLQPALALIAERQADRDPFNDVEVITVTIGGNDVSTPIILACLIQPQGACQAVADQRLNLVRENLRSILSQLTSAAGRGTEVAVTTYYDPIPACLLGTSPVARAVATAALESGSVPVVGLTLEAGLNDVIRSAAAATGTQVIDLYGQLGTSDVLNDCLHPNQVGHQKIADLTYATLAR